MCPDPSVELVHDGPATTPVVRPTIRELRGVQSPLVMSVSEDTSWRRRNKGVSDCTTATDID